jgi:hypothetical protein
MYSIYLFMEKSKKEAFYYFIEGTVQVIFFLSFWEKKQDREASILPFFWTGTVLEVFYLPVFGEGIVLEASILLFL